MALFYNIFAPKIASGSECYLTFIFMLLLGTKKTITGNFLCYTRNGDRYV